MKEKTRYLLLSIFIITEIILYTVILKNEIADTNDQLVVSLKLSTIVICLLFAVFNISKNIDTLMIAAAFVFTLISDLFLFYLNQYYEIGLITFIVVQLLYFFRIYYLLNQRKNIIKALIIRFAVFILLSSIILLTLKRYELLIILVIFYFINLTFNWLKTLANLKKKAIMIFSIGLFLFILCDICVGLNNLGNQIEIPEFLESLVVFSNFGMWLFYIPSQVIIAISGFMVALLKK